MSLEKKLFSFDPSKWKKLPSDQDSRYQYLFGPHFPSGSKTDSHACYRFLPHFTELKFEVLGKVKTFSVLNRIEVLTSTDWEQHPSVFYQPSRIGSVYPLHLFLKGTNREKPNIGTINLPDNDLLTIDSFYEKAKQLELTEGELDSKSFTSIRKNALTFDRYDLKLLGQYRPDNDQNPSPSPK